jgi:hypothetical protein
VPAADGPGNVAAWWERAIGGGRAAESFEIAVREKFHQLLPLLQLRQLLQFLHFHRIPQSLRL